MKRIVIQTSLIATLTVAATALTAYDADAATRPITSGTGWKLQSHITHIDTKPWQIAFHDTTSRTKLTPYLRKTAAELTYRMGVTVTVSTRIVPTSYSKCGPSHTISVRYMSKPNPKYPNHSFGGACALRGAAYSGYMYINSDLWAAGRGYTEAQRMNTIWHEAAHAVGLAHPNTCPKDKTGRKPLMCDVNGLKTLVSRRYSTWEVPAFANLRANRNRV
ncbi:hypothetical protein ABZ485_27945 [Streptomyces albogriseolus]|uniref:hypothetical protein n=1 Tax=Streptomyces albogriseolus TaxID=1887 RepID=UPI00345F1B03